MSDQLLVFSAAFAACAVVAAGVRALARHLGVVDYPDGTRKLHRRPVPLWGGVAVYLGLLVGLAASRLGSFGVGERLDELGAAVLAVAGLVCFFGCIDDYYRLPARLKLLLQIASVLPVAIVGYSVKSITLFGCWIELGWFGAPLTVLWLVGCINAINLLDGTDGLASMVGLFTAVMMGVIATHQGNHDAAVVAIALAGALAGFFVHNRPPASIFLGDSGSMVIGLVVGILGVRSTIKTPAALSITAPLVVMTFPMFDTFLAVVRRRLTGRRLAAADREHIHHRLLDRGLHPWLVLAIIGALCAATGAAAVFASLLHSDALAWITAGVLMILVVRLRLFGHHELGLIARAAGQALVALADRLTGQGLPGRPWRPAQLPGLPPNQLWASLIDQTRAWGIHRLHLAVRQADRTLQECTWTDPEKAPPTCGVWSLGVVVPGGSGRRCTLRAEGFQGAGMGMPELGRLLGILRLLASHFADHPEQVAQLGRDQRPAAGFPRVGPDRRKAA